MDLFSFKQSPSLRFTIARKSEKKIHKIYKIKIPNFKFNCSLNKIYSTSEQFFRRTKKAQNINLRDVFKSSKIHPNKPYRSSLFHCRGLCQNQKKKSICLIIYKKIYYKRISIVTKKWIRVVVWLISPNVSCQNEKEIFQMWNGEVGKERLKKNFEELRRL